MFEEERLAEFVVALEAERREVEAKLQNKELNDMRWDIWLLEGQMAIVLLLLLSECALATPVHEKNNKVRWLYVSTICFNSSPTNFSPEQRVYIPDCSSVSSCFCE